MWYKEGTYAKNHSEALHATHIGWFKIALLEVSTLGREANVVNGTLTTPTRY